MDEMQEGDVMALWRRELLDKTMSWREFMELFRGRATSTECAVREEAIQQMVSTLCQLPSDFLDVEEIELMMSFLLGRFEDSALTDGAVIKGIHFMVQWCELPVGIEKRVVQKLFIEGNFQQWAQKERETMLNILDSFITQRLSGLRSMGIELVLAFIRSVTGERDPRCLLKAFKLFCNISTLFPIGPFAEDMFDVVACYYPIEFKPSDTTTITREELVHKCEECLLSSALYAPLTVQLITEKLNDDDIEEHIKLEICSFMSKACKVLPTNGIFEQLDDILVGLRKVAFNPANANQDIPYELVTLLTSIIDRFSTGFEKGNDAIDYICDELLENSEPFVLQVQMGFTNRALGLLQVLAKYGYVKVLSTVFDWLILLVKGDTIESTTNRRDVMEQALTYIPTWCKLIIDSGNGAILYKHLNTLINAARNSSNQTITYTLAQALVSLPNADVSFAVLCDDLLSASVHDIACDSHDKRVACECFILALAKHNRDMLIQLLSRHVECGKVVIDDTNTFALLCWTVCDANTFKLVLPHMEVLLSQYTVWTERNIQALISVFSNNECDMYEQLFNMILSAILKASDNHLIEHQHKLSVCMQRVGLIIDTRLHSILEASLLEKTQQRPIIVTVIYLFIIQTQEVSVMKSLMEMVPKGHEWHKVVLMGAVVNKAEQEQYERELLSCDAVASQLPFKCQLLYDAVLCRQLLLTNRPQAFDKLNKLLNAVSTSQESSIVSEALNEVFVLDNPWSDVVLNRYKCTILAKQRIFSVCVPIFIEHFNNLSQDAIQSRNIYVELVCPLLKLVDDIADAVSNDLLKLLPLLCEALEGNQLSSSSTQSILSALAALLKTIPCVHLNEQLIDVIILRIQTIFIHNCSVQSMLLALECYESLARRCDATSLVHHMDTVISSIIYATASNKRTVRYCAANVRNIWELLPMK